jgi:hypothetical protein
VGPASSVMGSRPPSSRCGAFSGGSGRAAWIAPRSAPPVWALCKRYWNIVLYHGEDRRTHPRRRGWLAFFPRPSFCLGLTCGPPRSTFPLVASGSTAVRVPHTVAAFGRAFGGPPDPHGRSAEADPRLLFISNTGLRPCCSPRLRRSPHSGSPPRTPRDGAGSISSLSFHRVRRRRLPVPPPSRCRQLRIGHGARFAWLVGASIMALSHGSPPGSEPPGAGGLACSRPVRPGSAIDRAAARRRRPRRRAPIAVAPRRVALLASMTRTALPVGSSGAGRTRRQASTDTDRPAEPAVVRSPPSSCDLYWPREHRGRARPAGDTISSLQERQRHARPPRGAVGAPPHSPRVRSALRADDPRAARGLTSSRCCCRTRSGPRARQQRSRGARAALHREGIDAADRLLDRHRALPEARPAARRCSSERRAPCTRPGASRGARSSTRAERDLHIPRAPAALIGSCVDAGVRTRPPEAALPT